MTRGFDITANSALLLFSDNRAIALTSISEQENLGGVRQNGFRCSCHDAVIDTVVVTVQHTVDFDMITLYLLSGREVPLVVHVALAYTVLLVFTELNRRNIFCNSCSNFFTSLAGHFLVTPAVCVLLQSPTDQGLLTISKSLRSLWLRPRSSI